VATGRKCENSSAPHANQAWPIMEQFTFCLCLRIHFSCNPLFGKNLVTGRDEVISFLTFTHYSLIKGLNLYCF